MTKAIQHQSPAAERVSLAGPLLLSQAREVHLGC